MQIYRRLGQNHSLLMPEEKQPSSLEQFLHPPENLLRRIFGCMSYFPPIEIIIASSKNANIRTWLRADLS